MQGRQTDTFAVSPKHFRMYNTSPPHSLARAACGRAPPRSISSADCVPRSRLGLVQLQAGVGQNVTFSRLPSGKWLARTRMKSDGYDLGDKGRANSPP